MLVDCYMTNMEASDFHEKVTRVLTYKASWEARQGSEEWTPVQFLGQT